MGPLDQSGSLSPGVHSIQLPKLTLTAVPSRYIHTFTHMANVCDLGCADHKGATANGTNGQQTSKQEMGKNKRATENSGAMSGNEAGKLPGGGGIGAEAWLNDIKRSSYSEI